MKLDTSLHRLIPRCRVSKENTRPPQVYFVVKTSVEALSGPRPTVTGKSSALKISTTCKLCSSVNCNVSWELPWFRQSVTDVKGTYTDFDLADSCCRQCQPASNITGRRGAPTSQSRHDEPDLSSHRRQTAIVRILDANMQTRYAPIPWVWSPQTRWPIWC
jgi:hypothetical protein